jgi:hypothetical protein
VGGDLELAELLEGGIDKIGTYRAWRAATVSIGEGVGRVSGGGVVTRSTDLVPSGCAGPTLAHRRRALPQPRPRSAVVHHRVCEPELRRRRMPTLCPEKQLQVAVIVSRPVRVRKARGHAERSLHGCERGGLRTQQPYDSATHGQTVNFGEG